MLQQVSIHQDSSPELVAFLRSLRQNVNFTGDVSSALARRVTASSDNSIWQQTPQAVISPRTERCICTIVELLDQPQYRTISMTPRGGGTSTAGQSLTDSITLDCKRYLNSILDYDEESKQVHVESGVILDDVNRELAQFGVKVGPTVATSSRATIGGMIGNDSAGKGSSVYGKMSDCVVTMKTILRGGSTIDDRPELVQSVKNACDTARPYFSEYWPLLPRFATGYNLPMAWDGQSFDINRIYCGSEGTLGVTTSALLQCVDIPKQKELVLLGFKSFDEALRCGEQLRRLQPSAIETIDEMVIAAGKKHSSWSVIESASDHFDEDTQGLLFIEFSNKRVQHTLEAIQFAHSTFSPISSAHITSSAMIDQVWAFRSRSVGLLSSVEGRRTPMPFVEDCAVPPSNLAPFINEFKNLLRQHGLQAGMFGHVDAGVIHVRPALDMKSKVDRELVRTVAHDVAKLVQSYGGVLWGEHGKGFRSEFGPSVYGPEIWSQMCEIKRAFDPYNQFNPGKVAPVQHDGELLPITSTTRGEFDIKASPLPILSNAMRCDGNSECESVLTSDAMCPTSRVTRDPLHSPRGRANLLRYWLQQVGESPQSRKGTLFQRLFNAGNQYDFSHEVRGALDGCLSCKACTKGCPMQIDIPNMRSEFYEAYYGRYLRPLRDLLWFKMEQMMPILGSRFGSLFPSKLVSSLFGISDVPKIKNYSALGVDPCSPEDAVSRHATIAILQDTFTTYLRPQVLTACIAIAKQLGHNVAVLHHHQCGKALHIRGAMQRFRNLASHNINWLTPLQNAKIPIIGIDPAATLLWRDEYRKVPNLTINVDVLLPQEWLLHENLHSFQIQKNWQLFPHCIEKAVAPHSQQQWQQLFSQLGSTLELVETACCGMGGLFGHEREHKNESIAIWNMHWAPHNPRQHQSLATGYSCFSQALRAEQQHLHHPLEVIASANPDL